MEKSKILSLGKEYAMLIFGVLLFCAGWGCFMIPNNLSGGGLTGLCTVIQYATDGRLQVSYMYAAINVVLLAGAFFILGGGFGFKTIICIALSSLGFELFAEIHVLHALEGSFMYIPERFLIPVVGGLMEGAGLGIIFRNGGSTGGSDILALVINKYWPVSPGRFFLVSDLGIVLTMLLLPDRAFSDLIYGVIMVITSSVTIDAVAIGGRHAVQVMIFSDKYDEIADYINSAMDRGVTAIQAMGWYTKSDKKVLLVLLREKEVFQVTKMVKGVDKKAFLSISPANNVYGEGFEEIKAGVKTKAKKNNGNGNGN